MSDFFSHCGALVASSWVGMDTCIDAFVHILFGAGIGQHGIILDRPNLALHLPPLVWASQCKFSLDAVLFFGSPQAGKE